MPLSEALPLAGTFAGGLGLFLLAVTLLTDGLRLAAGDALRGILARSTATRLRGIATGMLLTAIVQSSSAVTVATIGFVNAGLLQLGQALGIVYGANVGTTMTGWLVALVGFGFPLELFALPLIGLGMALRLARPGTRTGAAGEALAGFGLFFVGIDVLRGAFEGLAGDLELFGAGPSTVLGLLAWVAVGFAMTVLTQSSSAAIALTLTAASSGVLQLDVAAAAVVGANVGTTSTAALAVLGATPAARRVALAHLLFNLLTAAVALGLLGPMLWTVERVGDALGLPDAPATALAGFHTAFNVLGVLLMLPLTPWLARFLARRFRTAAEQTAQPRHLDPNVAVSPDLAADAVTLELRRHLALTRDFLGHALPGQWPKGRRLEQDREGLEQLALAVEGFLTRLERSRLPADTAERLRVALRVLNYLEDVLELGNTVGSHQRVLGALRAAPVGEAVRAFEREAQAYVAGADPETPGFDREASAAAYEALRTHWHRLKDQLIEAGVTTDLAMRTVNAGLELLRHELRVCEKLGKAARSLAVPVPPGGPVPEPAVTDPPQTPAAAAG
ncbi:MAG: Na/Pi symporter [Pseudomonadales bacterium]|jgi:phosphate:Na+ symporter|nr:Na/Pi symporter [Pseudomonadales bacterium]